MNQDAAAIFRKLQQSDGPLVFDAARAEPARGRLGKFPESGGSIPEFSGLPHPEVEVIVRAYRFFFRVVGQTVWFVAVWRGVAWCAISGRAASLIILTQSSRKRLARIIQVSRFMFARQSHTFPWKMNRMFN